MKNIPIGITIQRAGLFLFAVSLPISHVPAQIGIGLAIIGWVYSGLVNKHWQFTRHSFLGILLFYVCWNIFAAILSPRALHSLNAVADNEWPLLIMLMMYWTIDDVQFLRKLLFAFLATASVAMLYAIWQTFLGIEFYRPMTLDWMGGYYRAVGFYGFYLTFAALAMAVFFFSFTLFLEVKKQRALSGFLALVSFLAVVASFARSIWLSLGVGIPLLGFIKNKRIGLSATGILILVVVVGLFIDPTIRARAESIFDAGQNQTRLNLWKTSLNIAQHYPILGVGEDNWDYFFPLHKADGYYDTTVHPHNDYLTVLVSSGVPGLIAFFGMWMVALRAGFSAWKKAREPELKAFALGATLSLLGFLVGSFFQNYYGTFVNCLGWWFVVGILMTTQKLVERNQTMS